ncbi:hypothetical protein K435DRAFT_772431 [Dendrothele bispora CBS 962.96]|uniref:Uncharacterized protein n=1 Tax=Dendrothele bispora (strain CBS 962.96) TaxID=1314807 RepID=A0A4S8MYE0_DENBC|nr:hypothetical protein K435DRAFT_772431 [Dendrothele bispora CBS 962.96]
MSEKTVKVHTHVSNRAKPKQTAEKKVVFKPVLDNPLRIYWPSVPVNLQNLVLSVLVSFLDGLSQHHRIHRKRKREPTSDSASTNKKRKLRKEASSTDQNDISMEALQNGPDLNMTAGEPSESGSTTHEPNDTSAEVPKILGHFITGINAVTKRLESQVQSVRLTSSGASVVSYPPIKLVLACRADVDPPILIDHLPHLVATCNSSKPVDPVILVPLPKGAEFTLADALGVRRAAVLSFDVNTPGLSSLTSLLESVPILSASWLTLTSTAPLKPPPLIQTHIKQLRTTAPKDMKAAKQQRIEGRAAAKEKRKKKS